MSKRKPPLPEEAVLKYETIKGTPTIEVMANLTTQAQVEYLINRLESLRLMLPAMRVRPKPKAKSSRPTARRRTNDNAQQAADAQE